MSLSRVQLDRLRIGGVDATFVFAVRNPNAIAIDLDRLGYQLGLDGTELVRSTGGGGKIHVPAQGTGTVTLPVGVEFASVVKTLEALVKKQELPYTAAFQLGFLTPIGVIEVPLSTSGKFPVPRLPAVRVTRALATSATLSGAHLEVQLELGNNNAFPLPLGGLRYEVQVAGQRVASGQASPGTLPASGQTALAIPVDIDFVSSGVALAQAVMRREAAISVGGDLDLLGYKLPLGMTTTLR